MQTEAAKFAPILRGSNLLSVQINARDEHEIVLIGAVGKSSIDEGGITEAEFRDALKTIPKSGRITLKVNSPGGNVSEGLGIYNAIKDRSDKVTARISGYALSIASVFPLAAGKVISPKSAVWMIHKAWAWSCGNADEMRKAAEMLSVHDETLADIYVEATGKSKEEILEAMANETWIKGADAVEWGLADETDEDDEKPKDSYAALPESVISRFTNIPTNILNALRVPPAPANGSTQNSTASSPADLSGPADAPQPMGTITVGAVESFDGNDAARKPTAAVDSAAHNQNKNSMSENTTPAAAQPTAIDALAEIKALKEQLLTDKILAFVDAGKITKAELPIFVEAAKRDESGTLAILNSKEAMLPGGETVEAGYDIREVESRSVSPEGIKGNMIIPELANIYKSHKSGDDRYNAMKAEFPRLLQIAARKDNGVQASNTFSGTVTTNFLIMGAVQKLSNRFAAARLFTRDNSVDPYKPLATGVMKFNTTATDGSQVQVNATNFEDNTSSGNSTIDPITITTSQYTSRGHITNAQLNSGFRLADVIEKKLIDLADAATKVFTAPITTANFTTNEALVSAPAAFGFSDLATLQGQLKKAPIKNLLLDGEYMARIANQPGFFQMAGTVGGQSNAWQAYGWDNVALNTEWSGAGANVRGFACHPQAIAIITGLPLNPPEGIPGNIVQTGSAMLPDVEIGIATYAWFSPANRHFYFSYDLIAGAALLDETAGVLIKSA